MLHQLTRNLSLIMIIDKGTFYETKIDSACISINEHHAE